MEAGLVGSIGTVAFFAFVSFTIWMDYHKKREEREATRQERMKSLEMGNPPLDAEVERARAYASAAWAAGLIGLLVPLGLASLALAGTIVALVNRKPGDDPAVPIIVCWSITGFVILVTILRSLSVIRQLPAPTTDVQQQPASREKRADSSAAFQEKPRGL